MDETQAKQQFLRTEILEKGYDATDFTDFLADKRDEGDDLDNWSKNSLEIAVGQFQDEFSPQDPESDDDSDGGESMASDIYRRETESVYFSDNNQPHIKKKMSNADIDKM